MVAPRHWFLIGAFVAVCVVGAFVWPSPTMIVQPTSVPLLQEELHAYWRTSVASLLVRYDGGVKPQEIRDALLTLTVAAQDRDLHLQLVLAFNALTNNDRDAISSWTKARAVFEKGS